jgi:hypothetical protein
MMMKKESLKKLALLLMLVCVASVVAIADTHIYRWHNGRWEKTGEVDSEGEVAQEDAVSRIYAWVEGRWETRLEPGQGSPLPSEGKYAQACYGGGAGPCQILKCDDCHSRPVSPRTFSRKDQDKHFRDYFPRFQLRLQEGEQIPFGDRRLVSEGGRLITIDQQKRKHPLPAGAMLLKARGSTLLVYRGSSDPPW